MNFNLREHTSLLTVTGSRAYGINNADSDIDILGFLIPPKKYLFNIEKFNQIASSTGTATSDTIESSYINLFSGNDLEIISRTKLEGVVYSLEKFINLAKKPTPSILDSLFCNEKHVLISDEFGDALRNIRESFLSVKLFKSLNGYANSQLARINNHRRWILNPVNKKPEREDFGLSEEFKIPKAQRDVALDFAKKKVDSWEIDFGDLSNGEVYYILNQIENVLSEIYQVESNKLSSHKFFSAAKNLGFDSNFIEQLDKERRYKKALTEYKQYKKWKLLRNPERAALEIKVGYDSKHGAHLYRLYKMSFELLSQGKYLVDRTNIDAEEIKKIRYGKVSYDELMDKVNAESDKIKAIVLSKSYGVQDNPDSKKINDVWMSILEKNL